MRVHSIALWMVLMAYAVVATGQEEPLRGPEVNDQQRRTLVDSTMTGAMRQLEGRPEVAAVQLLDLSDEQREAVQRIIDNRGHALVMLLVDGIDTVRAITDEVTEGRNEAARELMQELWEQLDPGTPRDPMLAPLAGVLTEAQTAELRRLLDEYWTAWVNAEAGRELNEQEAAQAVRRLGFGIFQREVREAYDASLIHYRQALEGLYEAVQPTPDEREAIRSIVIEHIRSTRLSPTIEDRRQTYRDIYDALSEESRERMFEYMVVSFVREQ